ncbi:MAG: amidohydrolase family protein [Bdellovibrionaceae bacterium]|nr:amidohydrolase family protein [Pseudobdellovibrionaceae bacterium]
MIDNVTRVSALYDSHVHWLMTGEKQSYFDLQSYSSLSDISADQFKKKNFRGDWLFGFGWDDSQLTQNSQLVEMARLSTSFPICFIKKDAHSCLLNQVALDRVLSAIEADPVLHAFVERDQAHRPTGILKESAFYAIYPQLPPLTSLEIETCLLQAQSYFLERGFTHIRDMTCSIAQWQVLKKMEKNNQLRIFSDINFNVDNFSQAHASVLPFVMNERTADFTHLKISGLKIFVDGSLGSRSALLMDNYVGTENHGDLLWDEDSIYQVMRLCWENNLEISVHALGDRAVDKVVDIARTLYSEKIRGYLNLEHVQLVHPDTIGKMKSLFVRCHMQPSHWLNDKKFLKNRLSPDSMKHLFSWEALRRAKVPISFGSDAPIEESDIHLTYSALIDSEKHGVDKFQGSFLEFYRHPLPTDLGKQAITVLKEYRPIKVELPPIHIES